MTPERAAELTRYCLVDYDWRAPPETRYSARYWQGSREYCGTGPTVLAAVVAAHRDAGEEIED